VWLAYVASATSTINLADIDATRVIVPASAFWRNAEDMLTRYGEQVVAKAQMIES
jgi:hypothetical protein